jgi:ribonuclease R
MSIQETHTRKDFKWPSERASADFGQTTEDQETRRGGRRGGAAGTALVRGIVKRHPDGYGFLIPEESTHPDVYIPRQSMFGIMTNDRVEVEIYKPKGKRDKDDRLSGEIRRVVTRANKRIVGRFLPVDQKYGVILDENRGWGADLRIATADSMGAKEGAMVAVEVTQFPGPDRPFTGKVVDLIGDMDDPVNDVIRVVHQQGIPMEFSKAAINEARKFGGVVTEAETKGREDLTHLPLITIDGVTAKDFDDAIFVEQTKHGFNLIVAIADVSHYVKPGTPLDEEAYERGTSTYFPNFVVPMLPEELSNELCSLKPHVKRLCFACEMEINFNGEVERYRFFEAVMESKARVTYGEAQEVIDIAKGAEPGRSVPEKLRHVQDSILTAADLAKILMTKRFREGSLDLEIPETQVVVDSTGETSDIIRAERIFAHRLIEELMLVTNICTARFMDEKRVPGIYRVHEEPDPDSIRALQRYLWNFGGNKSVMGGSLQKKLTQALQSMEGRPEAQILNILTLRTMQQAHYSQENVGHFGLGFSHYSHFTSPIRRYPDLIAHRIIKSQIYPRYESMQMSEGDLGSASTFLSACEQRSTKAERKVISIKKARFIRRFVGEEFEGIISSVAKFGVFVLLRQYDVDGLVKVENLGNDRFMFDDQNLRLIGTRTGRRFSIGDTIRVVVTGADPEQGKIDFELPDDVFAGNDDESDEDSGLGDEFGKTDEFGDVIGGRKKKQQKSGQSQSGQRRGHKGGESAGATFKSGDSKKKRVDVQKRGKAKNDSRGVRKERVSKRR